MKPPYRLPSMSEITSMPLNGLTHGSTFSGCGGTCLGFRMAGFKTLWSNERDEHAIQTYRANFPHTHLDERDIRDVTARDILTAANVAKGDLDVFEGSPPCQPFSMMGHRGKGWGRGDKDEERFFDWIRLLADLAPRAFVAENVAAMAHGPAKQYFNEAIRRMKSAGYRVEARVLDAQWLGVPQERKRLIVVGLRDDLGVAPRLPAPNQWRYGVGDALPSIQGVEGYEFHRVIHRSAALPMPTIAASQRPIYLRGADGVVRKPTVDELRRLSGFPHDFALAGSYTNQLARLGNSVPPPMAAAVAGCVRDILLDIDRVKDTDRQVAA